MGKRWFSRAQNRYLCGFLAVWGVLGSFSAIAAPQDLKVFPGEYIVQLKEVAHRAPGLGSAQIRTLPISARLMNQTYLMDMTSSAMALRSVGRVRKQSVPFDSSDSVCRRLIAEGAVAACSPNFEVRISQNGIDDPKYSSQWALNGQSGVSAPRAWEITSGSSDVVVAVVDTGIDYTHEDLSANMWVNRGEVPGNGIDDDGNGYIDDIHGINTVKNGRQAGNPLDDNGHGTHVAGIIGAVGGNGKGIVGVNQRVKLMALKFLDADGSGALSDALIALDYVAQMKARGVNIRVLNNSWGGAGYVGALEDAVRRLRDAGLIFVAAAGNESTDNDQQPTYPAGFEVENIVSVAAIDEQQNLADFSNFGALSVDIAAPGVDILSTLPGNRYGELSGTSMATPHVSGTLALLFAAEPGLSTSEAIDRLYGSGRALVSLFDPAVGVGVVRTQRTVDVGRMLHNETQPLPDPNGSGPLCEYALSARSLAGTSDIDTSADNQAIIQQSDEGDFQRVDLPFPFPFFNSWLSSIFISPNGVVYAEEPSIIDYRPGTTAPPNSIAALHVDLNPSGADQGVRVFKGADRVTVQWKATVYRAEQFGPVQVRLTINRDGTIRSSVAFEPGRDQTEIKRLLFGDPFSSPALPQKATIGIAGASARAASTLDTVNVVRGMISSYDQDFTLETSMTPQCKEAPRLPTVQEIRLLRVGRAQSARSPIKVRGTVKGDRDGPAAISFAIDSGRCPEAMQLALGEGTAVFRAVVPRGPSKIVASSGDAQGTLRLSRGISSIRPRSGFNRERLCRALVRSARVVQAK